MESQGFFWRTVELLQTRPGLFLKVLYQSFQQLWLTPFLAIHVFLCGANLTTNESANGHKYAYLHRASFPYCWRSAFWRGNPISSALEIVADAGAHSPLERLSTWLDGGSVRRPRDV